MRALRAIVVGLISGSVAVLLVWFTRVMQPPRDRVLPDVIRLDTLDAYARNPSQRPVSTRDQDALLGQVVESFVVSDRPLGEALALLGELANVNIVAAWDDLDVVGEGLTPEHPVTAALRGKTVQQVLAALLDPVDNGDEVRPVWFVRDGIVYVTSSHRRPEFRTSVRVYDVRDLMLGAAPFAASFPPTTRPAPMMEYVPDVMQGSEQDIADRLISALAAGEFRHDGEIASAYYFAGRVLFDATPEGHRSIERRLAQLREAK